MKQDIYIFGAGGLGKETACLLRDLPQYNIAAFVDRDDTTQTEMVAGGMSFPVISESEFEKRCIADSQVCAVIAIGKPGPRFSIAQRFGELCQFPNIIHPSVVFTGEVTLGKGNLITHHCFFTDNITIGGFNYFNTYNTIGHDVIIGSYNSILPSCNISGCVAIGNRNLIGAQTFIIEGKRVGNNNIIGAGSVVLCNMEDNSTWVGSPAKEIKRLKE